MKSTEEMENATNHLLPLETNKLKNRILKGKKNRAYMCWWRKFSGREGQQERGWGRSKQMLLNMSPNIQLQRPLRVLVQELDSTLPLPQQPKQAPQPRLSTTLLCSCCCCQCVPFLTHTDMQIEKARIIESLEWCMYVALVSCVMLERRNAC